MRSEENDDSGSTKAGLSIQTFSLGCTGMEKVWGRGKPEIYPVVVSIDLARISRPSFKG